MRRPQKTCAICEAGVRVVPPAVARSPEAKAVMLLMGIASPERGEYRPPCCTAGGAGSLRW